ncbi:MAG TPA: hypothetical protein VFI42_00615 [Thermomicrobiaceae bacterium]|nr:hypothetical protein [Thermomicrobiaceae bacterium]
MAGGVVDAERWEPPAATAHGAARARRRRTQTNWGAALELVSGRLLAALIFLIGGLSRAPALWLPLAGCALVAGLILAGCRYHGRAGAAAQVIWLADAATLGVLLPLLLFNAFAATGAAPLRASEEAVYLETAAGVLLVLAGLFLAVSWRAGADRLLTAVALVPAALLVPGLAEAHRDLRDATVAAMLALAWLLAALISLAARWLGGQPGRLLPLAGYLGFTFILLIGDPGFVTFGGQGAPVGLVEPLLLLLCGLGLLGAAMGGQRRSRQRRGRRRGIVVNEEDGA